MSRDQSAVENNRELKRGSDGARRKPCDGCGTADESSLIGPEGTGLLLCDECLLSCAESAEVLDREL
jgi:hypothetical protein